MTIDPGRGFPMYAKIAAVLREQITSGGLVPGDLVPGELALSDEYGVSRQTAAKALDVLAAEGFIRRRSGMRSRVLDGAGGSQVVEISAGARIRARLPRSGEREAAGAAEWEPVLVVEAPGQPARVYPADRTTIIVTG